MKNLILKCEFSIMNSPMTDDLFRCEAREGNVIMMTCTLLSWLKPDNGVENIKEKSAHTHTHSHSHTHYHTVTHTTTHTFKHTLTLTKIQTHTQAHTITHTHTHTNTHTHTPVLKIALTNRKVLREETNKNLKELFSNEEIFLFISFQHHSLLFIFPFY